LKNRIENIKGWSTSGEETLEYFGAKGALSLKNENIMCDGFIVSCYIFLKKRKTYLNLRLAL
jgi:hypothetical protein